MSVDVGRSVGLAEYKDTAKTSGLKNLGQWVWLHHYFLSVVRYVGQMSWVAVGLGSFLFWVSRFNLGCF